MKVAKTTYEKLGYHDCPRCFPGEIVDVTEDEAVAYLNANADNAILLVANRGFIAVWRGWRGDLKNFYVQTLPLENTEDAEGGDINALYALTMAQVNAEPDLGYAEGIGGS